ncbi:Retrotransposon-derived protein PEG10 [Anabarilius grahami]|uniref:Retrotransposon-derived protein PEG10 n=1 Tax=Anabarilius grahami TaxID=495550 RepID=A0A3N0ZBK5_ANAGA|nr:Retrotransposon-derived protein PEG10 [Anabarilius grahami]
MVVYDDTLGLENLIQKTIRVAQRYSTCALHTPTAIPLPATPYVALPAPESMQVDSYRLTRAERQRRIQQHLCWYCGGEDHAIAACPIRPPRPAVSTIQLPARIAPLTRTTVHILNSHVCVSAKALIDSGSAGNFISNQILQKLNVRRKRCQQDLRIQTIQGKPLGRGHIRHFSPTLTLRIGCLHMEDITFMWATLALELPLLSNVSSNNEMINPSSTTYL